MEPMVNEASGHLRGPDQQYEAPTKYANYRRQFQIGPERTMRNRPTELARDTGQIA